MTESTTSAQTAPSPDAPGAAVGTDAEAGTNSSELETPVHVTESGHAERAGERPPSQAQDVVAKAASSIARTAQAAGRLVADVVMGRRINGLLATAPYVLRGAGLAIAVAAFLFPLVQVGLPGLAGWLADAVANLLLAYVLFVGADAAATLIALSEGSTNQSTAKE